MRKFLFKLFWFILPIVIIAYPVDLFISYNLKKSDDTEGEFQVWNEIYDGRSACEIAVYGSSRAAINFNSKLLEDALYKNVNNFGLVGHGMWMQYLRHSEFFKHNNKPKQIIISLDTFSLTLRSKNLYAANQFLPYLFFNPDMEKFTSADFAEYTENGYTKFDCYLPLIRYMGKSKSLNRSAANFFRNERSFNQIRYKGFISKERKWDEELDLKYYKRVKFNVGFEQESINLFEKLILECKSLNIDVILVFSPEFIEFQKLILNRSEVVDLYQNIAAKYHLLFLDYSNDEMAEQKEFFYDSLHLNRKGADIFTASLASKIKELGH